MSWKNNKQRHSLAKKGIKTNYLKSNGCKMSLDIIKLIELRLNYLKNNNIPFDYYPPETTNDGKCKWIYTGEGEYKSFNNYPAFKNYLIKKGYGVEY